MTLHGWVPVTQGITRQLLAGLLCRALGKCLAFTELVLSMLKMVIILDGWLLLVLAGVLGESTPAELQVARNCAGEGKRGV